MIAAETLTLSATLFHADVDAWLPADFGIARPEAEKAAEWDAALRGAQRDRLGIGHPELLDAGARKRRETAGAGIAALRKMGKGKREEEVEEAVKKRRAESDSEDESRTRAVGKKKTRAVDVFGGGKKTTAAVHPLLVLKKPIPGYAPSPEKDATKDDEEPADGPGALATVDAVTAAASKAQAKREKRRRAKARKAGKA